MGHLFVPFVFFVVGRTVGIGTDVGMRVRDSFWTIDFFVFFQATHHPQFATETSLVCVYLVVHFLSFRLQRLSSISEL